MDKLMNSVKKLTGFSRKEPPGLTRSDYSLVSCSELTTGQLWLSLPEEVKGDPAFDSLRQLYENERSKESIPLTIRNGSSSKPKRLPLVNSAPHLNNNVVAPEGGTRAEAPAFGNGKEEVKIKYGNEDQNHQKQTKIAKARHYTKMTLLLACWVFFTVVFLMYSEKEEITRNTFVTSEVKSYTLNISDNKLTILLTLSGPFLSEQSQQKLNTTQLEMADKMDVWLERWRLKTGVRNFGGKEDIESKEFSQTWTIVLHKPEDVDFNVGEPRSKVLHLASTASNTSTVYAIQMKTDVNSTTPLTMSYTLDPLDGTTGVLYACVLLVGLYVLIIFEVINRTMAAVIVSTTSVAVLAMVGERPSLQELISWLDTETLLLLFSMMLLVAIMAETGMFDFLAVFTFEVTKGKLWPLITLLCAITALLSTFLDNVTTVLLMTPVTIRLCEVMDLDPVPILMSMVLFSNIGGTMTPVGDPPNVIIASNKAVIQAGINFTNFTLHMSLGIVLVCIQTYAQLRFIYRDTNKLRLKEPRDIQELRHQISIWRRAADSLPHLSKDVQIVRERLERKIRKLNVQLETRLKENTKRACPKSTFQSTLQEMKDKYKIRDKILLVKSSVAITFVVAVFFLHSIPEFNRVSLGWTALLGAILLLTLADREDLEPILHRVEWSTLLFFAALFVLMEALSKLGLIQYIGGLTESLILKVDEGARLAAAIILLLWVSGITSAFVDNIPLTTMMIRIVTSLGSNPNLDLPMTPLVWALAFGACLGGNGTLIGASANVVCAGVAEQYGYKFTFMQFLKIGFPVMIGHLLVASVYLLICHCAFTWH
ncbi:P protein [Amyelois transitella]|uniref:P protein n=1 Tax=Amyelois transitella TaxID=680683 RepID=UPI00067B98EE|nr:P protein [Amyelois transitella]XP_013185454.1 P protein [Amyelois transitella]XP_013185455.1 P protein [Amyelois transitella]XP_013185456.1 P protein [Amyelois transitella]XP_013185458.1 P protein [Amyelois transitella]XP_013185459.1 P protein [Amyelois transitella]XP_060808860.1 P protein [Amyelois transitella]XP_060808861.1 P protein [Amyelois transitella]XP_060808863.1 P protein [Amyelois transitella]XP_060808864.1 P protein [Amyelois transitella]XP_060808866.1 P protein [Amyelois 